MFCNYRMLRKEIVYHVLSYFLNLICIVICIIALLINAAYPACDFQKVKVAINTHELEVS